jgi:hypothetical protein
MILERPYPKSEIEGYNYLVYESGFEWVRVYQKRTQIRSDIRDYKNKISTLQKMKPTNEDVLKNAISDLNNLNERMEYNLSVFLDQNRGSAKPFSTNIERLKDLLANSYMIDEKIIKAAVARMPVRDDCMPIDEKQKEILKYEKMIKKNEVELEKVSPPEHFLWQNGKPVLDLCENFENRLRLVQSKFLEPSNILGFRLSDCEQTEQDAWRNLGIRSAMAKGKMTPIPMQ